MKRHDLKMALVLIGVLFFSTSFVYAQTAEEYSHRADLDIYQRNFTQADSDYTKAIKIKPNFEEAYFGRGLNFLIRLKNYPQAISDFTKVIELNPKQTFAYASREMAYERQGNFTQAISDDTKVIEMSPSYEPAYISRGDLYAKQGNFTQAISDYNQAIIEDTKSIEKLKKNPPVLMWGYYSRGIDYIHRGDVYAKQGNFTQANSDYNQAFSEDAKAIEIDPKNPSSYYYCGIAYFKEKEYDKAWADVHKAESLGYKPDTEGLEFLAELKKASGKDQ